MADYKQLFLLVISFTLHVLILIVLVFGFEFTQPIAVIQNTNKTDVISAVVLGDTAESKILPEPIKPIVQVEKKVVEKVIAPVKPKEVAQIPDAIGLKKEKEKKELLKAQEEKKKRERLAKNLLADIKKESEKQKKLEQKKLRTQFEKTLRETAEKSLRQQLLNEEIALKSKHAHEAQGEINKYKALIVQSISEHWLVPPSADRKLFCQLMIRLAPSGNVLDVQIIKSSGDKSLDRSARAAVLKASPLPVPSDQDAFEAFKEFVLKVKPTNILKSEANISSN